MLILVILISNDSLISNEHYITFCYLPLISVRVSALKAVDILEAYEGTLEDDYPPENERYEHGEMLLYKVAMFR